MTERQDSTRTRLLEATLEVLVTHGAARATSREIAAAAGVNLQAITYHFGSKDHLVVQALLHAVRRWVEPARDALAGVGDDPVGHLLAAVLALRTGLAQAAPSFPAYVEALAAATRDDAVRGELVALLRDLREGLAGSIRELRDRGLIADWVEPEAMAAVIVAAGDGFVLHAHLDPQAHDVDAALDQVVRLLLAARAGTGLPPDPTPPAGDPAGEPPDREPPDREPADREPADRERPGGRAPGRVRPDREPPPDSPPGARHAVLRRPRPPRADRNRPATPAEEDPS